MLFWWQISHPSFFQQPPETAKTNHFTCCSSLSFLPGFSATTPTPSRSSAIEIE
jgi:hypothetical protein